MSTSPIQTSRVAFGRLPAVLRAINGKNRVTDIAAALYVSEKTVERDIKFLRGVLRVPISTKKDFLGCAPEKMRLHFIGPVCCPFCHQVSPGILK